MRIIFSVCTTLVLAVLVHAQEIPYNHAARQSLWPSRLEMPPSMRRQELHFPAVGGWKILKAEFHVHTIYSDGQVTPEVRVLEAWRDGIDVLGISDHAEHIDVALPQHKERSYGRAKDLAGRLGLQLILTSEISTIAQVKRPLRNSDFIVTLLSDEQALSRAYPDAMAQASKQNAITIWAHPGAEWNEHSRSVLNAGTLHGIEIYNSHVSWSRSRGLESVRGAWMWPHAMEWAERHELAVFAGSDAHWPIDLMTRGEPGGRRPMTLILSTGSDSNAIREAILERRTVAWFGEMLWGPRHSLEGLVRACVSVVRLEPNAAVRPKFAVGVTNACPLPFNLLPRAESADLKFKAGEMDIPPQATLSLPLSTSDDNLPKSFRVELTFANVYTGPGNPLVLTYDVN